MIEDKYPLDFSNKMNLFHICFIKAPIQREQTQLYFSLKIFYQYLTCFYKVYIQIFISISDSPESKPCLRLMHAQKI